MTGSDSAQLVVLATNDSWNVVNYRAGLVRALLKRGFRLAVLAPPGPHEAAIAAMGAEFHPIPMAARGKSPIGDARTFASYLASLRRLRPAAFLGFTAKPNIYGSLAAHALGVPVINNISGLGAVFGRRTALTRLVSLLYKAALSRSATVFFQNPDDRALFEKLGIVRPSQVGLLPGSGIDLERFAPRPRAGRGPFTFLFAARLLWDKGVGQYVEAARQLGGNSDKLRFQILGIIEPESAAAVPARRLTEWQDEGVIDFLGAASDVRDSFAAADCLVLPSYYREGTPRVLLEGSAMAIPAITTDAPGCREAVEDGVTGLLCEPRSVASLAAAMERMMRFSAGERQAMGEAARRKMEREFREEIVHRAYLDAMAKAGVARSLA